MKVIAGHLRAHPRLMLAGAIGILAERAALERDKHVAMSQSELAVWQFQRLKSGAVNMLLKHRT